MTPVAAAGGFPCEPLGLEALAVLGKCLLFTRSNRLSRNGPSARSTEAGLGGLCRGATRDGSDCGLASRWGPLEFRFRVAYFGVPRVRGLRTSGDNSRMRAAQIGLFWP